MTLVEMEEMLRAMDIRQICLDVATQNEQEMVELNRDQLAAGLRSDNKEIEPPYTRFTIFKKETEKTGLAAVTDVVTLFDTGEHYSKIYAKVYPDGTIEQGSKDSKAPKLEKKYSSNIYGLDDLSREALIEEQLAPDFQRAVKNLTGLGFGT